MWEAKPAKTSMASILEDYVDNSNVSSNYSISNPSDKGAKKSRTKGTFKSLEKSLLATKHYF